MIYEGASLLCRKYLFAYVLAINFEVVYSHRQNANGKLKVNLGDIHPST